MRRLMIMIQGFVSVTSNRVMYTVGFTTTCYFNETNIVCKLGNLYRYNTKVTSKSQRFTNEDKSQ